MLNADKNRRLAELEQKWLNGTISAEERLEYARWYNDIDEDDPLFIPIDFASGAEELRTRILSNILETKSKTLLLSRRKKMIQWMSAAAVLVLGILSYYYWFNDIQEKPVKAIAKEVISNDVQPGQEGAILILADGSTIVLDSTTNGSIARQGTTAIVKTNGRLAYRMERTEPDEIMYNMLVTPRGRQYNLTLPDGSQVWLNAESSLRFPTAFTGKTREVELTGEGYFEIAPAVVTGKRIPFIVKVKNSSVEVLGTHFNIMAYADEQSMETTLIEGSVKIYNENYSGLLKPGEQAINRDNGQIKFGKAPDIEKVLAWKNGKFVFEETNIRQIMRQLTRWYDVEVEYKEDISNFDFTGGITKYTNVSEVLKMLELTGVLKFDISHKKIIVRR